MLTAAKVTATKPNIFEIKPNVVEASLATRANKPPTIITDEIAFVTAIRGVCSAGVTLHTT